MDHWRLAYLGMRQIPRELSEFELATFFTYSPKERALIGSAQQAYLITDTLRHIMATISISAMVLPRPRYLTRPWYEQKCGS